MNIKNSKLIHGILALFYCLFGNAAEQDNWYIANEWTVNDPQGSYITKIIIRELNRFMCVRVQAVQKIGVYDLMVRWLGHHHSNT